MLTETDSMSYSKHSQFIIIESVYSKERVLQRLSDKAIDCEQDCTRTLALYSGKDITEFGIPISFGKIKLKQSTTETDWAI